VHRARTGSIVKAREAQLSDRPAIEALITRARFTSHVLRLWEAHLGDKGFIVVEKGTPGEHGQADRIRGALYASSDTSPVAWVHLASVDDGLDIGHWLDLSLPRVLTALSNDGVRELAWMDCGKWAQTFLEPRGFSPLAEVITLTKADRHLPDALGETVAEPNASQITLRPAAEADLVAIVTTDREAFEPHWWRSQATVQQRAAAASRFTVAEYRGSVVGYTERELHLPTAHLNRIAVRPHIQGRGVGTILLSGVLDTVWQAGARTVSLNTQHHNHRSRRLYDRFGFKPTGDAVTAWTLHIPV
jgi:ribosomal-protein-alanine N-acetyltransferase